MTTGESSDHNGQHGVTTSVTSTTTIHDIGEQMKKERKRNPKVSTGTFLLTTVVGVPLYLGVILPLAIVTQLSKKVISTTSTSTNTEDTANIKNDDDGTPFPAVTELTPQNQRKYDIVLLGATGFVGNLATEYMIKTYGVNREVKWAIAGRSKSKLDTLKQNLAKELNDNEILNIDTISVDTSKRSTLHALVKDTKSVATSAGPFAKYGSPVVEFCSRYGTHYVDITGEVDWHKDMIMSWSDTAKQTGAKIISFCGHDCVPWDLIVFKMAQHLSRECQDDLVEATCLDEMRSGGPSGGTMATVLMNIDGTASSDNKKKYAFNPLLRKADGSRSDYSAVGRAVTRPQRCSASTQPGKWEGPFVMSTVNTEIIKRTHALAERGNAKLRYREALVADNFATAFVRWFQLVVGGTVLFLPRAVRNRVVPTPGEGPSRETMEKGYLTVWGYGVGSRGNRVESAFYFPKEAGYMDTARMMVESGLCLALDADRLPVKEGGFYTSATGMGNALVDRLCKSGSMFASRIVVDGESGNFKSKL